MSKMTKPTIDVVRFQESDVIVASGYIGKTMTISGLGNDRAEDATFYNHWTSGDILGNKPGYVTLMNNYLGTNYNAVSDFLVGESNILTLADSDHNTDDKVFDDYNGLWTWNGSRFVQ